MLSYYQYSKEFCFQRDLTIFNTKILKIINNLHDNTQNDTQILNIVRKIAEK